MSTPTEGSDPRPPMSNFYLTFGVMYAHQVHPHWEGADPDGYVRIVARDEEAARHEACCHFGPRWAFLYDEQRFEPKWHPKGELAVLVQQETDAPLRLFNPSHPEYHGTEYTEHIGVRIQGRLREDSIIEGPDDPSLDVEYFHPRCAEEGGDLFIEVDDRDDQVLAFEMDWANRWTCAVCKEELP